ncbi:MAG TPA: beta galactosidase jelly roll domain-containing protein, partial [Opitutaceae bacterium]
MSYLKTLGLFCGLAVALHAQSAKTSLDGEWLFALDPVGVGVEQEWFKPGLPTDKWDKVSVPHCYTVDPRYHYFTGTTWYLRNFPATVSEGVRTFLRFEAVFYKAQVWLNGKMVGEHEGGYTPFEFDVTGLLAAENLLAVRVNNAWDQTTIPGSKTKVGYQSLNYGQQYPWMNYGGITREVRLITRPELYLEKVKIDAIPDLNAGTARLAVQAFVRNESGRSWDGNALSLAVYRDGKKIPVDFKVAGGDVAARTGSV